MDILICKGSSSIAYAGHRHKGGRGGEGVMRCWEPWAGPKEGLGRGYLDHTHDLVSFYLRNLSPPPRFHRFLPPLERGGLPIEACQDFKLG